MKAGWSSVNIGDVCDVVNGGTPKTGVPEYWGGQHQWITPAEMGKRSTPYVGQTERTITDQGLQNSSARPLPARSVILSSRAPIGHLVINTEPMATNQGCKGLVPRSQIDHKFLYYYLNSIVDLLNDLGTGATFKELSSGKLKDVPVPLPTRLEQQRIVTLLDEAFDGIATAKANTEKNLQNVRALFESHLESIFTQRDDGWTLKKLGDLAAFRNGINFTKSSRGDTVKIVGVRDFQKDFWAPLDSLDTVTTDGVLPESDMLKEHDLLFVRSNGNKELIGRCLLVGPVDARITHSGFTIRARLNGDGVKPEYLCHFLKSNKAKREMIDSGAGANISSLNQTTLAGLVIPFPSVAAQGLIVQQIETIAAQGQRLESIYQQKLAALDELKKSLLHLAFSGQL